MKRESILGQTWTLGCVFHVWRTKKVNGHGIFGVLGEYGRFRIV